MKINAPQQLRETVDRLLSDHPSPESVRSFFDLALRLAVAHFRLSKNRFKLRSEVGINSTSDLALDSISDLFERNAKGEFIRLRSYYESVDYLALTDLELWSATRRLISSAVSDAIFRHYRSADPSLAKIIRNVKRGVALRPALELTNRMGSTVLILRSERRRMGEPYTVESLSAKLMPYLRERQNITHALAVLETVLKSEKDCAANVRLSSFALSVRQCCVALNESTEEHPAPELFDASEIEQLLEESIAESLQSRRDFYVSRGKYTEETFEALVDAVRSRLRAGICSDEVEGLTNYEAFQTAFPAISQQDYRSEYRNVFEYFHRIAYDSLIDRARRWNGAAAS